MTGQPREGLAALKEALDMFAAVERRAYVGTTLGKIGTAYAALGDSLTAERWFKEALTLLGDEEMPFRGEVHESYGSFLLERGRAEEALTEFVRAEQYFRLSGSDGPAVGLIKYQARALDALDRHREAYERLSRHIDLTEQLDRERGEVILGVMLVELEAGLARDHELPALTTRVLSEANKSLRDQAERLERISSTDELTELYNRRYLNTRLRDEILRGYRQGDDVSLILFDVDGFKGINDRYSHLLGDEVLKRMATVLKGTFRRSDVVARWGGEEFAVLLPDTDKDAALMVAEKARTAVAAAEWGQLAPGLHITVSAGVATASEAGTDAEGMGMLKLADRRLYAAKNAGRNRTAAD
jgi:diguanylate cyclase (GGDEF)-like protein